MVGARRELEIVNCDFKTGPHLAPGSRKNPRMSAGFTIRGEIRVLGTIAVNRSIRELALLKRLHGGGRWRKLKGEAIVELADGAVVAAELHWYEAHGIGRRGMKIKKLLI